MMRVAFGEALLFFLPFALFALYLVVRRRNPLAWAALERPDELAHRRRASPA